MKRRAALVVVPAVLSLWCLASTAFHAQAIATDRTAETEVILADVAQDRLSETINALSSIPTRYTPTEGCRVARNSIYNYLSRLGLAVELERFRYASPRVVNGTGQNVVATIRGSGDRAEVLIVGAHYDSTSSDAFRRAPGADDNASGTAALLEIARVLSRHPLAATVRVIAFDSEELGSFGSEHAARRAKDGHEKVAAMLNLDMIGRAGKRTVAVVPDRGNQWLADLFVESANRYALPVKVVKRVNVTWARSDQASFWAVGYPALAIMEDEPDNNPHYHHPSDTASTLDLEMVTAVTRATLATLAELAHRPGA